VEKAIDACVVCGLRPYGHERRVIVGQRRDILLERRYSARRPHSSPRPVRFLGVGWFQTSEVSETSEVQGRLDGTRMPRSGGGACRPAAVMAH
jgi:hypothetical protein